MNGNSTIDLTKIAHEAMIERGFIPDFSPAIYQEVSELKPLQISVSNTDTKDLRNLLWFSIDNDDSRDLDQLTYATNLPQGKNKIYVAVANVDSLVKSTSAINHRAEQNTTSVYTPTKIFPMLPEKLSTDLTSLNPNQDRLAIIFEGVLLPDGTLDEYSIYLGYVHNYAQLAYDGLSTWLDGNSPMPDKVKAVSGLETQIRLQDAISQQLATTRQKLGALSFETIEANPIIANGVPQSISKTVQNRARILIENFMIVANTISARYSEANKLSTFMRVVTTPKYWDKIVQVAAEYGEKLPMTPDAPALEQFLLKQKMKDPVRFPDLSLTVIKLLGRGEYQLSIPGKPSPGHFGLALKSYSQSTAPNRRFPDLITQRLLLASITKQPSPYTVDQLKDLAVHCTQKEDDADKIERRMKKSAAAIILSSSIGKEFDGIMTGCGEAGSWVRIFDPPVDGKLVKGFNVDVGDRVRVKLIYTDPLKGFIDFTFVSKMPQGK